MHFGKTENQLVTSHLQSSPSCADKDGGDGGRRLYLTLEPIPVLTERDEEKKNVKTHPQGALGRFASRTQCDLITTEQYKDIKIFPHWAHVWQGDP